jgi:hypothetical protein
VYEFYHKKTEAIPGGRYMLFCDHDVVLFDGEMPYRDLPVYRVAPYNILGTQYGYSNTFDLLPIQTAINSIYSTILTNHNAFGVQNVMAPRGSDVTMEQVGSGMNFIEYNMQAGKPEALNLLQTSSETYQFAQMLEKIMETLSGISSVTRGNPEKNLESGTALALVQSMSLQFISGLQRSYVGMIEKVGTGIINMLRDYADEPRIAMIVGEANRTYMKKFTGDDLSSVNRVVVDMGNPLSKCLKKGTEVLMYDGTIEKVENIIVGDKVMGPDSKPRTVKCINSGQEMMYDIHTKDKEDKFLYGCNESHILTLRYCSDDDRYHVKKGDVLDITVKDYLELPKRHKRLLQGFRTDTLHFESSELTVPPYIIGAWLGDGNSATTAITTMDNEILEEWTNYAKSINLEVRKCKNSNAGKANVYFITSGKSHGKSDRNSLLNEFRSMELINNKHIPNYYKTASESDRLEILAGLLDTDGTLINETFVITQKSKRIIEDIEFVSRSLGFRTRLSEFYVDDNLYYKLSIEFA